MKINKTISSHSLLLPEKEEGKKGVAFLQNNPLNDQDWSQSSCNGGSVVQKKGQACVFSVHDFIQFLIVWGGFLFYTIYGWHRKTLRKEQDPPSLFPFVVTCLSSYKSDFSCAKNPRLSKSLQMS